jgi:hypothetical protein
MAITKMTAGGIPRTSVDGAILTIGAQGQAIMRPGQTNRAKQGSGTAGKGAKTVAGTTRATEPGATAGFPGAGPSSSGFQQTDALITSLDATYDALPDKTPWITYAAFRGGNWQLCANCQPDAGPKKLYRQYNWNNALAGLPLAAAPVDPTETISIAVLELQYWNNGPLGGPNAQFTLTPGDYLIVATAQLGMTVGNPQMTNILGDNGTTLLPSDFEFAAIQQIMFAAFPAPTPGTNLRNITMCMASQTGAPMMKCSTILDWEV